MALKDFDIDSINAPESKIARSIRAQLRLSEQWRVIGMEVYSSGKEYSDDNPHERIVLKSTDLKNHSEGYVRYNVSPKLRKTYLCIHCGKQAPPMSYQIRVLKHVTDKGYRCELAVNIPKLSCECGSTPRVRFPAADDGKRYTRALSRAVLESLMTRSRSATANEFQIGWETVDSIVKSMVKDAIPEQDLSYVTGVYVDETQFGHGQDYITTFIDQNHKVIFMCTGHGADTIELFVDHLIVQGGNPENIRFFSADMSKAYESGIIRNFPNADLVWDRFHLAKTINDAVNDIRKNLLRRDDGEPLKLLKYTVLTHRSNMSDKQKERLQSIRLSNPDMALAYDMKEAFLKIIVDKVPHRMKFRLTSWIEWVESEGHEKLRNKAAQFKKKMHRILAWVRHPVSNSVSEGVNKNIQDIRRQACGFKNVRTFFCMILLRQGDLTYRI